MNINDFNYRVTPVKKTRQYEVHTLSVEGFNQYLNKDSYLHNFLKSPGALYTKENLEGIKYNNLQQDNTNYLSPKNPNEGDEKFYHKKKDYLQTSRKFYPRSQAQSQVLSHNFNNNVNSRDQSKYEEENHKSQNISGNFNKEIKEKNEEQKNEYENNQLFSQGQNQNNFLSQNQNQNQTQSLFYSNGNPNQQGITQSQSQVKVQIQGQGMEKNSIDFIEKEKLSRSNFDAKKKKPFSFFGRL